MFCVFQHNWDIRSNLTFVLPAVPPHFNIMSLTFFVSYLWEVHVVYCGHINNTQIAIKCKHHLKEREKITQCISMDEYGNKWMTSQSCRSVQNLPPMSTVNPVYLSTLEQYTFRVFFGVSIYGSPKSCAYGCAWLQHSGVKQGTPCSYVSHLSEGQKCASRRNSLKVQNSNSDVAVTVCGVQMFWCKQQM